jgi:hypothetical protein
MKERKIIQFSIILYWTTFWGLSVLDKIIPAVQKNWVGKDFFALFVKFFESLGIKDPLYATIALGLISTIEILNFVCYLFAIINFSRGNTSLTEKWFYNGILSSVVLFILFSIGDQVFGDRFQLLEHGVFWMILIASWALFKFASDPENRSVNLKFSKSIKLVLLSGIILTVLTSISIFKFSNETFSNALIPVQGKEIADGIYKFDFPFLADRIVLENTISSFKKENPQLKLTYIYTGPNELNSKKKTHILLYLFTE